MGFDAAISTLASATLHPFRELIVKCNRNQEFTYFVIFAFTAVIAGAHLFLTGASVAVPRQAWPLLLLAATGELIYGIFVVATLRYGDISIYYPTIRSSALGVALSIFSYSEKRTALSCYWDFPSPSSASF